MWNWGDPDEFNSISRKLLSDNLFEAWNWNFKIRETIENIHK
jgi:hypothetical protein